MRACLNAVYGSPNLQGRTVAVQGVGAVGGDVVAQLVKAGAIVTITDVDSEKVAHIAADYGVKTVPPEEIYSLPVDVYCPCALGAVLNDATIPVLRCKLVCGSANNQLAEDRHGDLIAQREIVYAPDYIVNAGGALTNIDSLAPGGFNRQRAHATVARIYQNMEQLLEISRKQGIPTYRAADVLAEQRLARGRIQQSMDKDSER
jgi:leucine dehydrogenase